MTLVRHHYDDRIELSVQPGDANMAMPPSMALMDMVLFLELVRCHTGEHVIPLEVRIPRQATGRAHADAYFGVTPQIGKYPTLILSREDAERPLITENPELWSVFETDLHRRIEQRRIENTLERRVRGALQELLPSGQSSIDAVSRKLNMSKRSLQRKLRDEGQTFQTTLDATRSELSMRYLKQGDMTVEEISFLLAYQDPNSFYRAFHTWTGMTPMQARRAG
jgi:AraC-like DNA-binding protein